MSAESGSRGKAEWSLTSNSVLQCLSLKEGQSSSFEEISIVILL